MAKKVTGKKTTTKKKVAAKKTTKKPTKKVAKKSVKKSVKKSAKKVTKKVAKKPTRKPATKKPAPLAGVKVGDVVPDFEISATGDKTIRLSELRPKNVVLYFYPKDMTPGCTIEGHEFTQLKPQFDQAETLVFGISRDSVKSHEKFKAKENYAIDLLSDADEKVCGLFAVIKDKNMYGKMVKGIERSTFLVGADGRLLKEWRGVKVPQHAQEVLEYVKTIK